ncbi:LuxR C-terminal-related transcriptional regulator [Solirubrobacter phytolaccae]|uniref:LuxR C-terminal-related transcriptional regulator n=1 Tax=Solirubrobacter phytolaccae TaxID=1404360 RepID=A0A9X3SDS4_9ACTN|nr:LuxR C-terminal-related transcriptional regulator [Solirubrobacter phytolaccae]MDA0179837.1 LuxR C-terminal-related transcriptional regulator [Solirubrobacter phytolaccae]
MIDIVRRSKITPPRLPSAPVVRPRVHALLDAAARKPLTLVSASAGYGKSIAVATWLAERRINTAWVSVDAHDNDPLHLWMYVIGAAELALRGLDDEPSRRVSDAEGTAEPAIEALLAALAEQPKPLTIVLDDLHALTDRRALESIDYAEQRLPPNVRLILVTRVDPPLRGLPRMRGHGLLAELRDADLAFTREEAAALLRAADSQELYERSEGWPVALQLGALRGDGAPVTGRRKDVAAYLTAEVVGALDPVEQDFLLRSSVLPRLSAELCDHVLERTDSAAWLAEIASANLFIVALDDEGRWFRYHALFAEYLRSRLGPAEALHRRAAEWFEEQGLIEDAVEQAAAARDFDLIARALERHQLPMSRSGRAGTIRRWLELLPRELIRSRPEILTAAALTAGGIAYARVDMRRVLAQADRVRTLDPSWTEFHETARLLLAALYGDDDVAATLALSRSAVELARADAHTLEAPALAMLAWSHMLAGDLDPAWQIAQDTVVRADAAARPFGVVGALAVQSIVASERANPVMAERYAVQALHEAGRAGVLESTAAGCAHFGAALGALGDGRPADAERALRRARKMEPAIEGGALHAWQLATVARILAARGRLSQAERSLVEAQAVLAVCRDAGAVAARVEHAGREVAALREAGPAPVEPLSPAELNVLLAFGEDRTAREIGAALYLSVNTVKTHIRAIYRKLGVATREDALARAHALGLIVLDEA